MDLKPIERIPILPPRAPDSHKGDFGRVLVLAGSRGMPGAAALVGAASLRSGAGLVRVASPGEVAPTVATFEPSYMTAPLPQDDRGRVAFPEARGDLEELLGQADALAVGPGLGTSGALAELVRWVVAEVDVPTVLDADALNNLVGTPEPFGPLRRPLVITPHPGEFARLTGASIAEVQADREGRAAALARAAEGLVVVLKGHGTIVTDGRSAFRNRTGNPGMATGGAGDVLTGVVASLLGLGLSAIDAAVLATHAHGLAGDIAREHVGEVGLIAGDLVDHLPDAFGALAAAG